MDLDKRMGKYFDIPFKMRQDPVSLIAVTGSLQQQRFITAVVEVGYIRLELHGLGLI